MDKPTIVKKCYECTYFDWWEIDGGLNTPNAYSETVFADNASKARYLFFLGLESESQDLFLQIRCRRKKSQDLVARKHHPLLQKISEAQLSKMKHAVGIQEDRYEDANFYRNNYQASNDPDFDNLVEKKLAVKTKHMQLDYYRLTDLGKMVVLSVIPISRSGYEACYQTEPDKTKKVA